LSGASGVTNHCRNCSFSFGETTPNFCLGCGQDTLNHPPTFWEFVHEFVTHYVALEGKLWKSLMLLFFKPAELTREYRAGRKLRYISPLRLYITASFLFFLVVKVAGWGGLVNVNVGDTAAKKQEAAAALDVAKKEIAASLKEAKEEIAAAAGKTEAEKAKAQIELGRAESVLNVAVNETAKASIGKPVVAVGEDAVMLDCRPDETACAWLKQRLNDKWQGRSNADVFREMKSSVMGNIPYALFMLLPLFALLTKVFYVNRNLYFGEHMVYALHVHAFTFFILLLMAILPQGVGGMIFIAALVYYFIAMQRFFGGRWWANLLRYFVIGNVYPLMLSLVAGVVVMLVVLV
jgi:hypothetical protein